MATEEESIFFHELAHAAHSRLEKEFSNIESWKKEVVAELSAAVLCRLWDRIICKVCLGCGQKLSRYEHKLPYAFCFECRDVLFPETVTAKELWQNSLDKRKF